MQTYSNYSEGYFLSRKMTLNQCKIPSNICLFSPHLMRWMSSYLPHLQKTVQSPETTGIKYVSRTGVSPTYQSTRMSSSAASSVSPASTVTASASSPSPAPAVAVTTSSSPLSSQLCRYNLSDSIHTSVDWIKSQIFLQTPALDRCYSPLTSSSSIVFSRQENILENHCRFSTPTIQVSRLKVNQSSLLSPFEKRNFSEIVFTKADFLKLMPVSSPFSLHIRCYAIKRKNYKFPELKPEDLEEQFVRGSGPGGQAVNQTANCVVLKHVPTGIVIKCHESRSLDENRKLARMKLEEQMDLEVHGDQSYLGQIKAEAQSARQEKKRRANKKLAMKRAFKENDN